VRLILLEAVVVACDEIEDAVNPVTARVRTKTRIKRVFMDVSPYNADLPDNFVPDNQLLPS
jgi:hypothetical protein